MGGVLVPCALPVAAGITRNDLCQNLGGLGPDLLCKFTTLRARYAGVYRADLLKAVLIGTSKVIHGHVQPPSIGGITGFSGKKSSPKMMSTAL